MKFCAYCGLELNDDMSFCPKCGKASSLERLTSFEPHLANSQPSAAESKHDTSTITKNKSKKRMLFICFAAIPLLILVAILGSRFYEDKHLKSPDINISEISEQTTAEEDNIDTVPANGASQKILAFSENSLLIENASKSVIMLSCYDPDGELYCTGSAFTLLAENIFVTNFHVISGDVYRIVAKTEDGLNFDLDQIVAYSEDKDIAILSASSPVDLPVLATGTSSSLKKGEKVVAIGSPLGLINSVSTGVFSGYIEDDNSSVLQFTAPISSGSSGGALFNDTGEIIGVTYASLENGQNVNFAVPVEDVVDLWNERTVTMTVVDYYNSVFHVPDVVNCQYVLDHKEELRGHTFVLDCWIPPLDPNDKYYKYKMSGGICYDFPSDAQSNIYSSSGDSYVIIFDSDLLEQLSVQRHGRALHVLITCHFDSATYRVSIDVEDIVIVEYY